jgi:pilus assembly protein CpaF
MMTLDTMLAFFQPEELRHLIRSKDVSDVMVNADGAVFADRAGRLERIVGLKALSLKVGIQNIARELGKDIGEERPILDARLPDGSRVGAVLSAGGEMTLTIRKFTGWHSSDALMERGTITTEVREVLVNGLCGTPAKNLLISGGTSAGKSTLANALINHIQQERRLIVIEKPRELAIGEHPNAVRWEAEDAAPGKAPTRSVAQLLVASLRHRPDHIIMGEVREPEAAYELLQAMNTGHSGAISTIHADNAADALHRLADLALAAHINLSSGFVREQVARTINYVVHVARDRAGQRRVTELLHVQRSGEPIQLYPRLKSQAAA